MSRCQTRQEKKISRSEFAEAGVVRSWDAKAIQNLSDQISCPKNLSFMGRSQTQSWARCEHSFSPWKSQRVKLMLSFLRVYVPFITKISFKNKSTISRTFAVTGVSDSMRTWHRDVQASFAGKMVEAQWWHTRPLLQVSGGNMLSHSAIFCPLKTQCRAPTQEQRVGEGGS